MLRSVDAVTDGPDPDAFPAARPIVAPQHAHAAVRADMAVHDPPISGHEMPPGVAMAIARSAAVDADRPAVAQMPVRGGASELGNIGAADIGMAGVDRHDQVLAGRLCAGTGKRRRARRRYESKTGGQTGCRYETKQVHERSSKCVPTPPNAFMRKKVRVEKGSRRWSRARPDRRFQACARHATQPDRSASSSAVRCRAL